MRILARAFALATVLFALGTSSANAQSVGSLGDWLNDYELYVAEWETHWYTVVTWDDGAVSEYRSYSQKGAQEWATWLYLHDSGVEDVEIISREELSEWEYVETFGTYSQASAAAAEWGYFGYETDIRSLRVNTITETPYRRSRLTAPAIYPTPPIK